MPKCFVQQLESLTCFLVHVSLMQYASSESTLCVYASAEEWNAVSVSTRYRFLEFQYFYLFYILEGSINYFHALCAIVEIYEKPTFQKMSNTSFQFRILTLLSRPLIASENKRYQERQTWINNPQFLVRIRNDLELTQILFSNERSQVCGALIKRKVENSF